MSGQIDDLNLQRVYIWSLPRTLGTALMTCLSHIDGTQVIYEPFISPYYYGPEAKKNSEQFSAFIDLALSNHIPDLEHVFDDRNCTYAWVKQKLESNDYPSKKILLAKDHAYCLNFKYDMLPEGFHHAFLIRHPHRVLPSWKAMGAQVVQKDIDSVTWEEILPDDNEREPFKVQYELLRYVKENLDPNIVVIGADDLQNNPASILRQFCEGVGIPYSDTLLKWPADRDVIKRWKMSRVSLQGNYLDKEGGFYQVALNSTEFMPPKPLRKRSDMTADLQDAVDKAIPFYDKMREMCLKP